MITDGGFLIMRGRCVITDGGVYPLSLMFSIIDGVAIFHKPLKEGVDHLDEVFNVVKE